MGKTIKGYDREVNGKMQRVRPHQKSGVPASVSEVARPNKSTLQQPDWDSIYKDAQTGTDPSELASIYKSVGSKDDQITFMLARNAKTPRDTIDVMIEDAAKKRDTEVLSVINERKSLLPRQKERIADGMK